MEEGFTAVRLYPFSPFSGGLDQLSYSGRVRVTIQSVEAVRDAVGPDIDVMIDVVNRLTPPEAIAIGRALEPYDLYFFEDSIKLENIDAMAHVAAEVPIPLAVGDRLYTLHQFRDLLNKNGAAYLRPDPSLAGGITNILKITALAEASYLQLTVQSFELRTHRCLRPPRRRTAQYRATGISRRPDAQKS